MTSFPQSSRGHPSKLSKAGAGGRLAARCRPERHPERSSPGRQTPGSAAKAWARGPPCRRALAAPGEILVGTAGFEPATSCAQGRRANQTALCPDVVERAEKTGSVSARAGIVKIDRLPGPDRMSPPAQRRYRDRQGAARGAWRRDAGPARITPSIRPDRNKSCSSTELPHRTRNSPGSVSRSNPFSSRSMDGITSCQPRTR